MCGGLQELGISSDQGVGQNPDIIKNVYTSTCIKPCSYVEPGK